MWHGLGVLFFLCYLFILKVSCLALHFLSLSFICIFSSAFVYSVHVFPHLFLLLVFLMSTPFSLSLVFSFWILSFTCLLLYYLPSMFFSDPALLLKLFVTSACSLGVFHLAPFCLTLQRVMISEWWKGNKWPQDRGVGGLCEWLMDDVEISGSGRRLAGVIGWLCCKQCWVNIQLDVTIISSLDLFIFLHTSVTFCTFLSPKYAKYLFSLILPPH